MKYVGSSLQFETSKLCLVCDQIANKLVCILLKRSMMLFSPFRLHLSTSMGLDCVFDVQAKAVSQFSGLKQWSQPSTSHRHGVLVMMAHD